MRSALARFLRRTSTLAALTLIALGAGGTAAVFALVDGVLLRPLPYPHADRLVALWERDQLRGAEENVVAVPHFEAWRAQARSLEAIAALVPDRRLATGATPERVRGAAVSASWFDVVGVRPTIGRPFTREEEASDDGMHHDGDYSHVEAVHGRSSRQVDNRLDGKVVESVSGSGRVVPPPGSVAVSRSFGVGVIQ